jgi:hypothetical protein
VRSRRLTYIGLSKNDIKTSEFALLEKVPSHKIFKKLIKKLNKALRNSICRLFASNFSRAIQRAIVCPGQNHFENYQAGRFPCEYVCGFQALNYLFIWCLFFVFSCHSIGDKIKSISCLNYTQNLELELIHMFNLIIYGIRLLGIGPNDGR